MRNSRKDFCRCCRRHYDPPIKTILYQAVRFYGSHRKGGNENRKPQGAEGVSVMEGKREVRTGGLPLPFPASCYVKQPPKGFVDRKMLCQPLAEVVFFLQVIITMIL